MHMNFNMTQYSAHINCDKHSNDFSLSFFSLDSQMRNANVCFAINICFLLQFIKSRSIIISMPLRLIHADGANMTRESNQLDAPRSVSIAGAARPKAATDRRELSSQATRSDGFKARPMKVNCPVITNRVLTIMFDCIIVERIEFAFGSNETEKKSELGRRTDASSARLAMKWKVYLKLYQMRDSLSHT